MPNHHTREVPKLSEDQGDEMGRSLRLQATGQSLAQRARIFSESATGKSDKAVKRMVEVTRCTVRNWRRPFLRIGSTAGRSRR